MHDDKLDAFLESGLTELMDIIKGMPSEYITMISLPRYSEALKSMNEIIAFVKEDCPDAKVKIFFDELTGTSLCLEIIADEFNVYEITAFCNAIKYADTMSVVPRTNSTVNISFTYEDAKVSVVKSE